MPQSSFLGRVTKYSPRPRLNAAENRLTEVTAGVLEHVDGFPQELVAAMLDFAVSDVSMGADIAADDDAATLRRRVVELTDMRERVRQAGACDVTIRTQVGTSSGGFVDLEIRLRPDVMDRGHDLIFWVEVKHGAPVHGDQLEVYELDADEGDCVVLVVAPLQSMPSGVPAHMPVIPWQALADGVRKRCRREPAASR